MHRHALAASVLVVLSAVPGALPLESRTASVVRPLGPPTESDLAIAAIDDVDPVVAGELLTYTLAVTNNGPDPAENVVVTDTLPAAVQLVSADPDCAENPNVPGTVLCTLAALAAGASRQLELVVQTPFPLAQPTVLTNQAVVYGPTDPNGNNDTATENTTVDPQAPATADLAIEKTTTPAQATAGGLIHFTLEVTNNGPDTAQSVFVTDDLPTGLQLVSASPSCSVISDGSLLCSLGPMTPGETKQVLVTLLTSAGASGQILNTGSVVSSTLDSDLDNNTSSTATQVVPPAQGESADLVLAKSASANAIMPGDTFDYTLTISNQGPNTAENVVLFDMLPQGLSLVDASEGCGGDTLVRCDVGSVAADSEVLAVLTVKADGDVAGTLENRASVAAASPVDPKPGNNADTFDVLVDGPIPPLSLSPVDTTLPSGFVGEPYRVFFGAAGGDPPLTLTGDKAPPGLSFLGIEGGGNAAVSPAVGLLQGDAITTVSGVQLELRGVPTQPGSFVFPVTLIDSAAQASSIVRAYTLPIVAPLDVRPLSLPPTQVGASFLVTFSTIGGIPPLNFTSSDPLPPGLVWNGSSLTGTPSQAGQYPFSVRATDTLGNRGRRGYTLRVFPAGFFIVTETLPRAVVGRSYGAQMQAIGGTQPYDWRVDSALPSGIAFGSTGFFNGIPTTPTDLVVTVTVRDQTGAEVSADLDMLVQPEAIFENGLEPGDPAWTRIEPPPEE